MPKSKRSLPKPVPASLVLGVVSCVVVIGGMSIAGYGDDSPLRPMILPMLGVVGAAAVTGVGVARTGRTFPWVYMAIATAVVMLMTALGMHAMDAAPPEQTPSPVPVNVA